jgi:hypothetical protein
MFYYDVRFVFTSSYLLEGSCFILMFGSSLPPVVCRRIMSYYDVRFVFTSSCLLEGSCLILMFVSSLPPVVSRRAHVLL